MLSNMPEAQSDMKLSNNFIFSHELNGPFQLMLQKSL